MENTEITERTIVENLVPVHLQSKIWIPYQGLPQNVVNEIMRVFTFRNPAYERERRFNPDTRLRPRLEAGSFSTRGFYLNKGAMRKLLRLLDRFRMEFEIFDETVAPEFPLRFQGDLSAEQTAALSELGSRRYGQLVGLPGTGKRTVALALAGKRQTRTLIVTKSIDRMRIWRAEVLGKTSATAEEVGLLGDRNKDTDQPVIIGIDRSIYSNITKLHGHVGLVIVDQADTANLKIFEEIVGSLDARYLLGLMDRDKRPDGLTDYVETLVGPRAARLTKSAKTHPGQGGLKVFIHRTGFDYYFRDDFSQLLTSLCSDDARQKILVTDIKAETASPHRRAVVVSERIAQLQDLQVRLAGRESEIVTGETSPEAVSEFLRRYERGKLQILLCTSKSIDKISALSRTDRLVFASPVKSGEKIAGVLRAGDSTAEMVIWDYSDKPGVLRASLNSRINIYKLMSAEIAEYKGEAGHGNL